MGRLADALTLHQQELAAARRRLGPDHPETFISMNNVATVYLELGELDRAIPLLQETLRLKQAKLGEDHHSVLITLRNLARAYEKAGRPRDAERLFRQTIAAAARHTPRDDPFYSDTLAMLGRCWNREHRTKDAVPILRECLAIKEKAQPDDWTTAMARSLLGEALAGQREFQAAEPLLLEAQKALTEVSEKLPPLERDVNLRDAAERLVRLYEAWGQKDKAEEWRTKLGENPLDRGFPADPFAK
jgi:eukaryotic-like serine/threonine-protein kinase